MFKYTCVLAFAVECVRASAQFNGHVSSRRERPLRKSSIIGQLRELHSTALLDSAAPRGPSARMMADKDARSKQGVAGPPAQVRKRSYATGTPETEGSVWTRRLILVGRANATSALSLIIDSAGMAIFTKRLNFALHRTALSGDSMATARLLLHSLRNVAPAGVHGAGEYWTH